jgi:hypothetical protein
MPSAPGSSSPEAAYRQAPRPSSVRNGWLTENGSARLGCDDPMSAAIPSCQVRDDENRKHQVETNDHGAEAKVEEPHVKAVGPLKYL